MGGRLWEVGEGGRKGGEMERGGEGGEVEATLTEDPRSFLRLLKGGGGWCLDVMGCGRAGVGGYVCACVVFGQDVGVIGGCLGGERRGEWGWEGEGDGDWDGGGRWGLSWVAEREVGGEMEGWIEGEGRGRKGGGR